MGLKKGNPRTMLMFTCPKFWRLPPQLPPSILPPVSSTDHVDAKDVNIAAVEDQLFNHPDPYDLEETEHIDPALQERVVRSTTCFDVADYIKLNDPELKALITKVDSQDPGASIVESVVANKCDECMGKPSDWSVDKFPVRYVEE